MPTKRPRARSRARGGYDENMWPESGRIHPFEGVRRSHLIPDVHPCVPVKPTPANRVERHGADTHFGRESCRCPAASYDGRGLRRAGSQPRSRPGSEPQYRTLAAIVIEGIEDIEDLADGVAMVFVGDVTGTRSL